MLRISKPFPILASGRGLVAASSFSIKRTFSISTGTKLFDKILVANRGEIACRIMRTCRRLGIKTVAVYSEADANALHVRYADEAVCIGPAASRLSYLNMENVLEAVKRTKAQAVHPGYGFLSENTHFAELLEQNGVTFIGPSSHSIKAMGDKIESKKLAKNTGVNIIPGFLGEITSTEHLLKIAREIGYPVMVKASSGGGGKGMRIAYNDQEAIEGFRLSKQEALSSFGDDRMLVEKFIEHPRHIEIQILGDKYGNVVYLNERECTIQRRNQKVVEEAPSAHIDPKTREAMGAQAVTLAKAVGYYSAGTVEMLVDPMKNFYFLEMNTRLQVEHPVTEYITGLDLVEQMIRVAAGERLQFSQKDVKLNGWAMEMRVYAEDPLRNFLPSIGRLLTYKEPTKEMVGGEVRVDTGVVEGSEIQVHYDPLIAKLITWGENREVARKRMIRALDTYQICGLTHNVNFLRDVLTNPRFIAGRLSTAFIKEEFPEGYKGHQLTPVESQQLACFAALLATFRQGIAYTIGGKLEDTWEKHVKKYTKATDPHLYGSVDYVVKIGKEEWRVTGERNGDVATLQLSSGQEAPISCVVRTTHRWETHSNLFDTRIKLGTDPTEHEVVFQLIKDIPLGFQVQHVGSKYNVQVLSPAQYELSKFMLPPKEDLSAKRLQSPMPGKVISVAVKEGDVVEAGQELVVVEAMKMQNVLRAEISGKVKQVMISPGQDVSLDQVLIVFQ